MNEKNYDEPSSKRQVTLSSLICDTQESVLRLIEHKKRLYGINDKLFNLENHEVNTSELSEEIGTMMEPPIVERLIIVNTNLKETLNDIGQIIRKIEEKL